MRGAAAWVAGIAGAAGAGAGTDWASVLRGQQPIPLTLGGTQPLTVPSSPLLSNAGPNVVNAANQPMEALNTPVAVFGEQIAHAALPDGGSVAATRWGLRVSGTLPALGQKFQPMFGYTDTAYHWGDGPPLVAGSAAPFGHIRQYTVGAGLPLALTDKFTLYALAAANVGYEDGADLADAFTYTAIVSGQFKLSDRLRVGAAFVAATRLDDKPFLMAFPTLSWSPAFLPKWSIDLGTRGPAAAVNFAPLPQFRLTLEAGYATSAFRLTRDGAVPGGTAADREGYAELRLRWRVFKLLILEPKAGLVFGRRFEVFDSAGAGAGAFNVRPAFNYGGTASLVW